LFAFLSGLFNNIVIYVIFIHKYQGSIYTRRRGKFVSRVLPRPFSSQVQSVLTNQSSNSGGENGAMSSATRLRMRSFTLSTVREGQRWFRPWPAGKWV